MQGQCFYVPGSHTIIDTARPDGLSACFGETLEQVQARYPGATLCDFDDACRQIDTADNERYRPGELHETTEERFIEMLEVLPPMQWRRGKTGESFKMSELTKGDITACYVRLGNRYFEGYCRVSDSGDRLLDWAAMEYGKRHPKEYAEKYCQ